MKVFVVYDVTENKIRDRVIKILRNFGFLRVQKSVFLGDIPFESIDFIELKMNEIINFFNDSVYIFPVSKKEYEKCNFLSKEKLYKILDKKAILL